MSFAAAFQSELFAELESTCVQAENPFKLYMRLSQEKGGLIPQAMLADALDLSTQRISQLIAAHRFEVHQIGKMKFVTGDSFEAYLMEEKRCGRGHKAPTMRTLIHSACKLTKEEGSKFIAA